MFIFSPNFKKSNWIVQTDTNSKYYTNFSGSGSAGLIRSTSVPSVNGALGEDGEFRSASRGSGIGSVLGSQMGGSRADFQSTGSLHGRSGTPTDEQVSLSITIFVFSYRYYTFQRFLSYMN